ncbi:hypothetical protein AKO1_000476 [Acrasis kona]|uniref:Uncharacterized protein n=1 Tax=Acrasis kona TaxID=1008807 RepID=A0AAW2YZJ5_9EUKA
MLYELIQFFLKRVSRRWRDEESEQESKTSVIVVLNTDNLRTIQGPQSKDDLMMVSMDKSSEAQDDRIALRLKHYPDSNVSVTGHVDHNLLSFVMNILLSHRLKSIVIMKKSNLQPLQNEEDDDVQDIFAYKPSKAERTNLEERF